METGKTAVFAGNDELSRLAVKRLEKAAGGLVVLSQGSLDYPVPSHYVIDAGNLAGVVEIFRRERITQLALVGRFDHGALMTGSVHASGRAFLASLPDWRGESILAGLAQFLGGQGVTVLSLAEVFAPELAARGPYTTRTPDETGARDIQRGAAVLRALLPYRIGQSLAIKQGVVLAVEGIEGTDRMIERTGELCRDFTVVKIAGADKDERFDLPVVGVKTVRAMHRAGAVALAVEAGKTLIVHKEEVVELADKHGIALEGI